MAGGLADARPRWLAHGTISVPAVAGAWIAFGLVAGLVEYVTVARGPGLGSWYVLGGPVLASAIWIPLTLGAASMAERRPLLPLRRTDMLIHFLLAVSASFVLNLAWGGIHTALGSSPWPGRGLLPGAAWAGLRNLHLNAGTWMAIVLFVTVWNRRRETAIVPDDARWVRTLPVRVGSRTVIVPVEEIDRIEGAGDYVRLHAGERRYLLAERMKVLERRLDPAVFARVHRSTIVNLTRIAELSHRSHGDYEARLEDGSTVRVSRSRSDAIRDLL